MKYLTTFLAVALALALCAPMVLGQEEVMTISSAEQGLTDRPPVVFSHGKHSEIYECTTCHHEYDKFMANKGGGEAKCSECHQPSATAKNPTPFTLAFHQGCKGCHLKLIEMKAPKTGPIMCGDCHRKGAPAAKAKQAKKK
ncbi:MAG: cytochrome c3 family protein [Pseudomonadota bacterium]